MASITFWNRMEPRPRANSIGDALSARVRDPLWLLTRQWQMGEYQAADAGSPAWVEYTGAASRMTGWRPAPDGEAAPPFAAIPPGAPLERTMLAEPFAADWALAVEIGQSFETLLSRAGAPGAIGAFRDAFPVPPGGPGTIDPLDQAAAWFLAVCAGRAIDGHALVRAARASAPKVPAGVALPPGTEPAARSALATLIVDVDATYGAIGDDDPPGWRPERLDHALEAQAGTPDGATAVLAVHPGAAGALDPSAFDLRSAGAARDAAAGATAIAGGVLPIHVRFRGMPNARWWDFESGTTSFGNVHINPTDLSRLVVLDFMLVHGNDWFVIPLRLPVGSLCRLEHVLVHDVFGGLTRIDRGTDRRGRAGAGWTIYTTSVETDDRAVADWFLLPDSGGAAIQDGDTVEEVRLARDELADLVWAIEHATENAVGEPWSGDERDLAMGPRDPAVLAPPTPPAAGAAPLVYHLQTSVPANWIPFLPVSLDPLRGLVVLERGAMPRPMPPPAAPVLVAPAGRILRPKRLGAAPYRLREQEVPRVGVKVMRAPAFCRWSDGSRHLWLARSRDTGRGEAQSNLRFDQADPRR